MRILCLGDSPFLKTGFGIVNEVATDQLLSLGHELIVIGGQDAAERTKPGMTFIPADVTSSDRMGMGLVTGVVEQYKPDAVSIVGDLAMTCIWRSITAVRNLPGFAYAPVEGAPNNFAWIGALATDADLTLYTCSNYGQQVLAADGIAAGMAYHGVSDDFGPLPTADRAAWREAMTLPDGSSWTDKFVVTCVAQNVRRKQWPRLFEAIRLVSKRHPEVILYAHTMPFNNYWLGGHALPQLAAEMGVWDRVVFPPSHQNIADTTDVRTNGRTPGLAEIYGISDAFVLLSQVEGFGLPLAEAMKSGVPVITNAYGAGGEVVGDAGILIEPYDWEVSHSHARYGNIDPREAATQISRLVKSVELRKTYSRRGIARAQTFRWDDYRTALTEWSRDTQEVDQA